MDEVTRPCINCGKQRMYNDEFRCYQCNGSFTFDVEADLRARGMSQRHIDQFMRRIPPNPETFYD